MLYTSYAPFPGERGDSAPPRLDPLNPFVQGLYAVQRAMARVYDEAIAILEVTLRKNPGAAFGKAPLSGLYHLQGRYEEALAGEAGRI